MLLQFYCLPDGYEVVDASLEDIKVSTYAPCGNGVPSGHHLPFAHPRARVRMYMYVAQYVLQPTFSPAMIQAVDSATKMSRALDGSMYFPGIMGLNNIKYNDYVNVAMQVRAQTILAAEDAPLLLPAVQMTADLWLHGARVASRPWLFRQRTADLWPFARPFRVIA